VQVLIRHKGEQICAAPPRLAAITDELNSIERYSYGVAGTEFAVQRIDGVDLNGLLNPDPPLSASGLNGAVRQEEQEAGEE
jgi:hypothetical protein